MWELPTQLQTTSLSNEIERNFYSRCPPESRPVAFRSITSESASATSRPSTAIEDDEDEKLDKAGGDPEKSGPTLTASDSEAAAQKSKSHKHKSKTGPKYDASLVRALHKTFFWRFWFAGVLKLASGMLGSILRFELGR